MRTFVARRDRIRSLEKKVKMSLSKMIALPSDLLRHLPLVSRSPFLPWGVEKIGAPSAWKHTRGEHVHIAVIDTGADFSHKDLRHALGNGYNVLQPHLPPLDDNGHGTHIAGTIAARNAQSGMTGVSPSAVIHPVKAFDHNGSAYVSDIVTAIEWCMKNRIQIINMSFGLRRNSEEIYEAVRKAYRAGIVIVASAGNDGKVRTDYPARYSEVISVGATTRKLRKLKMSNRGANVDIYAPGEQVISTWLNGRYHVLSGTSMAAAYVTGAAAMLLSLNPRLKPGQIKKILKESVTPAPRSQRQAKTGVLNVQKAVRRVMKKRHMRSGADTPIKRRTLRSTVRTQPTKAKRA